MCDNIRFYLSLFSGATSGGGKEKKSKSERGGGGGGREGIIMHRCREVLKVICIANLHNT